ncbi:MAG: helix-turn-helix transcriptional regulator [Clostridia bacterium]|nr:helix-turn-helix transcriptional regulator [Clostridia bacterium]
MFNRKKFMERIKALKMNVGDVAAKVGMDESTLYRKIKGVSDFSRSEVSMISEVLNLNSQQMCDVFFGD